MTWVALGNIYWNDLQKEPREEAVNKRGLNEWENLTWNKSNPEVNVSKVELKTENGFSDRKNVFIQ